MALVSIAGSQKEIPNVLHLAAAVDPAQFIQVAAKATTYVTLIQILM